MLLNKALSSHRAQLILFIDLTTSELKHAFNPIGQSKMKSCVVENIRPCELFL